MYILTTDEGLELPGESQSPENWKIFTPMKILLIFLAFSIVQMPIWAKECPKIPEIAIVRGIVIHETNKDKYSYTEQIGPEEYSLTICYPITVIGYDDHNWCIDSVEHIFSSGKLVSVSIPKSVHTIGHKSFKNNKLVSVTIPDSVHTIGYESFKNNKLVSVTIPDSVHTIEYGSFSKNHLTSITIGSSVEIIGRGAFSDNFLENVIIPDSVTTIEGDAFSNNHLTSITIGNSILVIGGYGGYPFSSGQFGAFRDNFLENVIIPDSVTTIGGDAFSENHLTSITIGSSVEIIGRGAFNDNFLESVIIPDSVTTIGEDAFGYNPLSTVSVKDKAAKDKFTSAFHASVKFILRN